MSKPVHVLNRDAEVEEIVNVAAIAVVDAQDTNTRSERERKAKVAPSDEERYAPAQR